MLILSRKTGEKIRIGDDVIVTICAIDRNKIRVGIEAPADVKVMRTEVADRTGKPVSEQTTRGRAAASSRGS